jgi:hypothetical protein
MRWSLRLSRGALVAGVLVGAGFAPAAYAQQGTEFLFNVYKDDETVDPTDDGLQRLADAVRNVQRPDRCPLGELKIIQPKGDPLFMDATARARRDGLLAELDRRGLNVAGRLFAVIDQSERGKNDVTYTPAHDDKPPTLRTESTPPKGTKVQPGQRIVVRMAARDDANRWQTGIKTIQLVADSDGGRFIASENYQPCSDPKEKRVEATYVVPANPPAIVRLIALAEDHAGLMDKDIGEFPTGDFYGMFNMTTLTAGQDRFRARADIVLNHDGRGNLTGTMTGQHEYVAHSTPGCSFRMVQPNRFRVSLVGSFTERSAPATGPTLKVFIRQIEETALTAEASCGGPIGPPGGWKFKTSVFPPEVLLGTPGPFGDGQVLPDGTREYKLDAAPGGVGTRWAVTLRRARN